MSLQEAMHSLVQGVIGSQEARAARLATLRDATAAQREAGRGQLRDLHSAHWAMAKRQRTSLAKAHADLAQGEVGRKSDVSAWMGEVAADRAGAAKEWQEMIATMRAPEAGAAKVVEAPPRKAPAPRAAAEEQGAGPVSLQGRAFDHLAGRPDGTRLTDLEQEFGVSRFQMTRALRELTDKGKVEKRGTLYFAI